MEDWKKCINCRFYKVIKKVKVDFTICANPETNYLLTDKETTCDKHSVVIASNQDNSNE